MTKTQKHHVGVLVEKNAFIDEGEGIVNFPKGLPITDNNVQRNGTTYDIDSMDISEYKGHVTADHVDKLENIIARVEGIEKNSSQVVVKKIRYAVKENPLARLAYNLLVSGFSTDFSIETYGPSPEGDGVYHNAKLIGLSQVVVGNNKRASTATLNELQAVVKNSLEQSKEDGLDTTEVEKLVETEIETTISADHVVDDPAESEKTDEELEAEKQAEIEAKEQQKKLEEEEAKKAAQAAEEAEAARIEAEEKAKKEADEEAARQKSIEDEEKQNNNKKDKTNMKFVTIKNSRSFAVDVTYKNAAGEDVEATLESGKTLDVSEDQQEAVQAQVRDAVEPKADNSAEIEKAVNAAKAEFDAKIAEMQEAFNAAAKEPKFVPFGVDSKVSNKFVDIDYKERHAKQINAAWEYLKLGNVQSANVLNEINQVNLDALKKEGKVENSMSISDFGNFVISPELYTDIQGYVTDYSEILNATEWRETLSLEFAWMKRNGEINMQSVDLEPGVSGNGNLKPISEYSAEPIVSKLEELAAVTPVCNAATRFLAVDLLGDIARMYRNDYDKKRAQLVIARLQQAVDENPDNVIDYTVGVGTSAESLVGWSKLWTLVSEVTTNGTFIFNTATFSEIQQAAVLAGANGPLANIFQTGSVPTIFGRPYVIVPNDLLPTLNSGETKTFVIEGENVVIDNAVFYLDLSNFTGRTSGGLQYDLSTDAAYEQGGVVKSAYQRNEMVLRGSFFRGGAIFDDTRVSAMSSAVATVVS